jgi:hypothetical protein
VKVTKRTTAWLIIAGAISVMALRRLHTLYGAITGTMDFQPTDITDEYIALLTSAMMAIGLFLIGPLFRSITQAAEAIRKSEEKYRQLVDNIPAVVFTGYADGSVDFFDGNKVEKLTGYSKEDFGTSLNFSGKQKLGGG